MMRTDRTAVICDLAETYGVLDYTSLRVSVVAALAVGLPDSSRIKRKIAGIKAPLETMLLLAINDKLSWLCWAQSEDGRKNRNRPKAMLDAFLETAEGGTEATFASPEEYEAARAKILRGM